MIAISFRFTAGRFHATPWGRHVNEGLPEWPPSPWRILRAVVAAWHRTMPDVPQLRVLSILGKLLAPPQFSLPPATLAHSRHFMPKGGGPDDRTLVFDTFLALEREKPVIACWPDVELNNGEQELLRQLLGNLPYLGRAESWCQAAIETERNFLVNCQPIKDNETVPPECELVHVLAAEPMEPEALLRDLCVETGEMRGKKKRLDPPGSCWLPYVRRRDCFEVSYNVPSSSPRPVAVARFALDARPLPQLVDAIAIGELARRSIMGKYGRANDGARSPVFSGKSTTGTPLQGHQHAFYLPTDEDGDGRIDHLTVYARDGFGIKEQAALGCLQELNPGDGRPIIRLVLLGLGTVEEFTGSKTVVSSFGPAEVWRSITPFALNRHPKTFNNGKPKIRPDGLQVDGPQDQLEREWRHRCKSMPSLPDLISIEPEPKCRLRGRELRWLEFRRWRTRGSGSSFGLALGYRLRFSAPVSGPIALGYGCHFGLGQFAPDSDIPEVKGDV